jgi:hypothetical protein
MGQFVPMNINMLDKQIGNNVESLVKERGLKFKPFAQSLPLDVALFGRLRKGKSRWNTTYLELISNKLEVSVGVLMGLKNGDEPLVTPKDQFVYSKMVRRAEEIKKSWTEFNDICDHFFAVYESKNSDIINLMQNTIKMLGNLAKGDPHIERKRKPILK